MFGMTVGIPTDLSVEVISGSVCFQKRKWWVM